MSATKVMRPLSASTPSLLDNTLSSYPFESHNKRRGSYSIGNNYDHGTNNTFTNNLSVLLALPTLVLVTPDFASKSTNTNTNNSLDENKENIPIPPPSSSPSSPSPSSPLKCSTSSLTLSQGYLPLAYNPHDTSLCIGSSVIPHPAKRAKGGEDAFFISQDMKTIGIADGVGGWGDIGVDPALYSRMLMASGKYSADYPHFSSRHPVKIMSDAYDQSTDVQGSSTCCIVVLDGYQLKTANLGDSGFMVIRGSNILYRSKEQQHSFNFPYQLGTGSADLPHHAVCVNLNILPGDLLIVGTDGLFDNLYDEEILEIAQRSTEPTTIAQLIAREAHEVANSKSVVSPFAKSARENGYPLATGGKLDDITVVVARIVLSSDGNTATLAA